MENIKNQLGVLFSMGQTAKGRMTVLILTIVLFVLSAAAPNAGIGIAK